MHDLRALLTQLLAEEIDLTTLCRALPDLVSNHPGGEQLLSELDEWSDRLASEAHGRIKSELIAALHRDRTLATGATLPYHPTPQEDEALEAPTIRMEAPNEPKGATAIWSERDQPTQRHSDAVETLLDTKTAQQVDQSQEPSTQIAEFPSTRSEPDPDSAVATRVAASSGPLGEGDDGVSTRIAPPDAPKPTAEGAASVATQPRGGATAPGVTAGFGPTSGTFGSSRFASELGRDSRYSAPQDSAWSHMMQPSAVSKRGPLAKGDVLKQRFVLEKLIGKGGMAMVYKARDLRKEEAQDRNPVVAIKILSQQLQEHPDSMKILQREARKAQDLAHPNIITVFDFDRDGSNIYMTMEFMDGVPMDKFVKKHPEGMSFKVAQPLIEGMGQALIYAHKKNIIHSDFKPGNVFVLKNGVPKVLDFGIARAMKAPKAGAASTPRGRATEFTGASSDAGGEAADQTLFDPGELGALTPAYASFEMLEGWDPDPRDDIYALACVTYELLSGKHPFNKTPATRARETLLTPAPIKGLRGSRWRGLLRGLAFEREARTPSVEQFLREVMPTPVEKQALRALAWGMVVTITLIVGLGSAYKLKPEWFPDPDLHPYLTDVVVVGEPFETLDPELQAQINERLEVAEVHQLIGRLVSPAGGNAYETYLEVLELHPGNPTAIAALEQIVEFFADAAEQSMEEGNLELAEQYAATGHDLAPKHAELAKLHERLGKRR